jgi:crotonobetainyl-CoA:carnitine CoA-transferase CaiB-like acyl-CoA transferase
MAGILEGIKVISMGQIVAIPAASSVMADWGADVIKLEPLTGEMHRGVRTSQGVETAGQINWIMQVLNRNSRGLALDLKTETGKEIVYRLVRDADIFMSNYERNSVRRLGLDYASLSRLNPRLIYGFVSGYGPVGPDKDERGYDFTAGWARSGMMYMIGEPGTPPAPQRAGMIDSAAGAHLLGGICAALLQREKTGRGQEIEVSLYHTGAWSMHMDIQMAMGGRIPVKHDRTKPTNPIWNSYRTKDDRWFWLAMLQPDPAWPGFCRAIGKPELQNDQKFNSIEARRENSPELVRIIEEVLATRTMREWEELFKEHNCIYGRVQTPLEVTTDPQSIAAGFFADVDYSGVGSIKILTSPVLFDGQVAQIKTPAPELGQHTEEILLDLGYTWDDIGEMKERKVIL